MQLNVLTHPAPPSAAPRETPTQPAQAPARDHRGLLRELLSSQQNLTAVERFSRQHDRGEVPAQAKHYRDLIPLSTPAAGEQYAFDVDLDACSGCKACVTACHNLNGLDENEVFRDVGLLVGGTIELPIMQHVTSACHHCLEPACLEGCPVNAYDKDPTTGIVKHLDDQCIGCQYCIFKCPYDVPKYNARLGIVRKCDMCSDRLSVGEAPACVQACPNQAIRITLVEARKVVEDSEANQFVPGTCEPDYTLPTTNYRTRRVMPRNLLPADHHSAAPQHAHPPLVAMLVLTQLSVGAFLVDRVAREAAMASGAVVSAGREAMHAVVALAVGLLALGASTLHLGRPLYAFRAIIGLRTSWLSREIVAFGLFAAAAGGYAACAYFLREALPAGVISGLGTGAILLGLLGVFCSAMLYHDTRRPLWTFSRSGTAFLFTSLVLGTATTLFTWALSGAAGAALSSADAVETNRAMCLALAVVTGAKLVFEVATFRHLGDRQATVLRKAARLLAGPLRRATVARFALGLVGGVLLPLAQLASKDTAPVGLLPAAFMLAFALAGELVERYLFFAAAIPPKMPGVSPS